MFLALSLQFGCSSGSGSGSESSGSTEELKIKALLGDVSGATCTVSTVDPTTGDPDETVGTGVTDENGLVSISIPKEFTSVPLYISCDGGEYLDEATGETLTSDAITAYITSSEKAELSVTGYSTMMTSLLKEKTGADTTDDEMLEIIEAVHSAIQAATGVDDILLYMPEKLEDLTEDDAEKLAFGSLVISLSVTAAQNQESQALTIMKFSHDFSDGTFDQKVAGAVMEGTTPIWDELDDNFNAWADSEYNTLDWSDDYWSADLEADPYATTCAQDDTAEHCQYAYEHEYFPEDYEWSDYDASADYDEYWTEWDDNYTYEEYADEHDITSDEYANDDTEYEDYDYDAYETEHTDEDIDYSDYDYDHEGSDEGSDDYDYDSSDEGTP